MDGDGDVTVSFGKREIKFNPECLRPSKGSVFNEDEEHEETREKPHGNQGETKEEQQGTQDGSSTDVDSDTKAEESEEGMDDISGTFLSSFMYLINGTLSLHHPENLS